MREAVEVLGVQPDACEQLARSRLDLVPRARRAARSGVARICATRLRGFSDACGSWKTICISRRIGCSCLAAGLGDVLPRKRIAPPVVGTSRTSARISVVLPQPDSPTTPSVSPSRSANDTSSTACTAPALRSMITPRLIGKSTRRCSTSSSERRRAARGSRDASGCGVRLARRSRDHRSRRSRARSGRRPTRSSRFCSSSSQQRSRWLGRVGHARCSGGTSVHRRRRAGSGGGSGSPAARAAATAAARESPGRRLARGRGRPA